MGEVQRWADAAMFRAEDMPFDVNKDGPQVYMLSGTPDPLGSVAAFSAMYTGKVIRDKRDVTNDERNYHLQQMLKTKLKAPLEAVDLHFMIEGVTRSFTHQMVRQRTAVYAQESLRFAVKEDISTAVALPPSLADVEPFTDEELGRLSADEEALGRLPKPRQMMFEWQMIVLEVDHSYTKLVNMGMPAEDARGLLPHNITTRLNYHTNLRALQDHAGNRLCTQAQFEWRRVLARMVESIRNYCSNPDHPNHHDGDMEFPDCDNWQWYQIAKIFKPVCYLTGKCEFGAEFDRECSIRGRVTEFSKRGIPSSEWEAGVVTDDAVLPSILPYEWMLDPEAAR